MTEVSTEYINIELRGLSGNYGLLVMPTESSPAEARCQSPFRPSCRAHPYLYTGVEPGFESAAAVVAEHLAVLGTTRACHCMETKE